MKIKTYFTFTLIIASATMANCNAGDLNSSSTGIGTPTDTVGRQASSILEAVPDTTTGEPFGAGFYASINTKWFQSSADSINWNARQGMIAPVASTNSPVGLTEFNGDLFAGIINGAIMDQSATENYGLYASLTGGIWRKVINFPVPVSEPYVTYPVLDTAVFSNQLYVLSVDKIFRMMSDFSWEVVHNLAGGSFIPTFVEFGSNLYIAGFSGNLITVYSTTDGNIWTEPFATTFLDTVDFSNFGFEQPRMLVGNSNGVALIVLGGRIMDNPPANHVGHLYYDSGSGWSEIPNLPGEIIFSAQFIGSEIIVGVASLGTSAILDFKATIEGVYMSTNGVTSWQIVNTITPGQILGGVFQNSQGTFVSTYTGLALDSAAFLSSGTLVLSPTLGPFYQLDPSSMQFTQLVDQFEPVSLIYLDSGWDTANLP